MLCDEGLLEGRWLALLGVDDGRDEVEGGTVAPGCLESGFFAGVFSSLDLLFKRMPMPSFCIFAKDYSGSGM